MDYDSVRFIFTQRWNNMVVQVVRINTRKTFFIYFVVPQFFCLFVFDMVQGYRFQYTVTYHRYIFNRFNSAAVVCRSRLRYCNCKCGLIFRILVNNWRWSSSVPMLVLVMFFSLVLSSIQLFLFMCCFTILIGSAVSYSFNTSFKKK